MWDGGRNKSKMTTKIDTSKLFSPLVPSLKVKCVNFCCKSMSNYIYLIAIFYITVYKVGSSDKTVSLAK